MKYVFENEFEKEKKTKFRKWRSNKNLIRYLSSCRRDVSTINNPEKNMNNKIESIFIIHLKEVKL